MELTPKQIFQISDQFLGIDRRDKQVYVNETTQKTIRSLAKWQRREIKEREREREKERVQRNLLHYYKNHLRLTKWQRREREERKRKREKEKFRRKKKKIERLMKLEAEEAEKKKREQEREEKRRTVTGYIGGSDFNDARKKLYIQQVAKEMEERKILVLSLQHKIKITAPKKKKRSSS